MPTPHFVSVFQTFRQLECRLTDGQTDGTDSITSTADAGGNKALQKPTKDAKKIETLINSATCTLQYMGPKMRDRNDFKNVGSIMI